MTTLPEMSDKVENYVFALSYHWVPSPYRLDSILDTMKIKAFCDKAPLQIAECKLKFESHVHLGAFICTLL
jgi:hypothetical protein